LPRLKSLSLPIVIGTLQRRGAEKRKYKMAIKRKISKKMVMKLALFAAVLGIATLFDIYFEKDQVKIIENEANSSKNDKTSDTILLISQTTDLGVKTSVQKTFTRKFQVKSQNKFIQKYYQLRNYQVLKAEVQTQTAPLINSYHYLAFKNYFYSIPDNVPLHS
jgi:hypothetical protein